jgi:type III restriction enzyme
MTDELTIKSDALEPLFAAWEEPNKHRVRKESGEGAEVRNNRRPSPLMIAQNLRAAVKEWRENFYFGASETTRQLLTYWFEREHSIGINGGTREFRYYFCQREAIETLIYLKEVRRLDRLSQVFAEYGGQYAEEMALGITEDEDAWSRYAFKMATGSGKTKVMSLAIVWSYFHALRESDSPMARHFLVIAPNLTVFERLKEDFKPEGGGPDIFDNDPLIPVEWRGDWNLSVVLQDEASGATTGGVLYLTNIHRLFDKEKRKKSGGDTYDWMGPAVSKAKALDTGAELRDRITAHARLMVLNDEAHHLWDPDSAWNEAIQFLDETCRKRGGNGLNSQLDFSATPKDNKGNYFKHIICDTPLGEAVDAGIVKTPIIGRVGRLVEQATDNAAYRYEAHLLLGYKRWLKSKEEWEKSGKKPLLFVMCNDTTAADQIASRLNGDEIFKELNGRALNLHIRLKGKIKTIGSGAAKRQVFVEDEKGISDEDLKELRKLSRELDSGSSPYYCIVSVLMLREGWDVRNVTTIVPLRPYTSKAGILPEQTLGRGLRRITPPGQANEIVAVVEHEAFARLYREELSQEGLPIEIVDVEKVPTTTVSIFPDPQKDWAKLDLPIPRLTAAAQTLATLDPISEAELRAVFQQFKPLPLGEIGPTEVPYEGRHLITGEVVEHMKVNLALLQSGVGAISFYVQELEYICKVKGAHQVLAPLLQVFFEQLLFGPGKSIFDPKLVARLSDGDVREHVRAVFVPIIRKKTVRQQVRAIEAPPVPVSSWRPFQVTVSERRPVLKADRTVFNLVPCNRSLEQALVEFLGKASDMTAFAKNAGPQALRIDYLADGQRLAFYTPDFLVRTGTGYYVAETKGQVDRDVPAKARAAAAWCKSASGKAAKWEYVFIAEEVFQRFQGTTFSELMRMCAPSLNDLLSKEVPREELPLFAGAGTIDTVIERTKAAEVVAPDQVLKLPERFRKAVDEAVSLYLFFEKKQGVNYAPVFSALLGVMDEAAKGLVIQKLSPYLPQAAPEQREWFAPYLAKVDHRMQRHYQELGRNLQKTLVYKTGVSPLGLLRNCLDFALNDQSPLTGVFTAVREEFRVPGARPLLSSVQNVNDFRNTRVAHQEKPLCEVSDANKALKDWVDTLVTLWDDKVDAAYASTTSTDLLRFREKGDQTTDFVAEIRVILPQIALSKSAAANDDLKEKLRKAIEVQLQHLADHRFGANNVRITCAEIRSGSIDLTFIISTLRPYAAAAAAYTFVKDYDKLRANTILLVGDIKRGSGKLKKVLDAMLTDHRNTLI